MKTMMKSMTLFATMLLLVVCSANTQAQSKQEAKVAVAVEKRGKAMERADSWLWKESLPMTCRMDTQVAVLKTKKNL